VAGLDCEALERLVSEDGRQAPADDPPSRAGNDALLDEAIEALENLDRHRLYRVLSDASVAMSGPAFRHDLVVPLLCTVGQRWQEGSLRIVHEHLASIIVRSFLAAPRHPAERVRAPRIVVTTPAGQYHELGALMAATVAEEMGWDVFYLGASLPAEEIAAAARQVGAKAVALSVCYRESDSHVLEEISRLRVLLNGSVPVFVGGNAANPMHDRLKEAGVKCPLDLAEFRAELQSAMNA
jgi:methylmalonyl-CoA mutase cobalamin-binding subunit